MEEGETDLAWDAEPAARAAWPCRAGLVLLEKEGASVHLVSCATGQEAVQELMLLPSVLPGLVLGFHLGLMHHGVGGSLGQTFQTERQTLRTVFRPTGRPSCSSRAIAGVAKPQGVAGVEQERAASKQHSGLPAQSVPGQGLGVDAGLARKERQRRRQLCTTTTAT